PGSVRSVYVAYSALVAHVAADIPAIVNTRPSRLAGCWCSTRTATVPKATPDSQVFAWFSSRNPRTPESLSHARTRVATDSRPMAPAVTAGARAWARAFIALSFCASRAWPAHVPGHYSKGCDGSGREAERGPDHRLPSDHVDHQEANHEDGGRPRQHRRPPHRHG